jgi:hypothetical protein
MVQSLVSKFGIKHADNPRVPQRRVQVGSHHGSRFEVAVAYSASADAFAAHAYWVNDQGQQTRLGVEPLYADDESAAFDRAWSAIDRWVSQ